MTQAQTLARALVLLVSLPLAASAQQKTTLPAQDKLLREKPTQLYSVGAEDGEDWELLAGVRGVAFDQKDNLYVLDGNNYRVLVFDANGKFVRQISKKGGGPGELLAPISMAVTVDGAVVVSDLGRRAYSLFSADGKFIRNVTYDEEGGGPGSVGRGLRAHPKGGVVGQIRDMPGLRMMGGAGRGREGASPDQLNKPITSRTEINWFDLKSAKPVTMYAVDAPTITPKVDDSGSAGGERRMQVRISQPEFMPTTSFGVLPTGGLAIASQAEYRVEVINAECKVERVIERPIAPKKVTQRDKELAIKNRREGMSRGDGMVVMMNNNGNTSTSVGAAPPRGDLPSIEQMMRDATFMDVIPVLRRIETDPQGRIWIQRTAPDFGVRGPVDLVARDGRYIGTIPNDRAPDAVSPSGRAAYIDRDALNVERVLVKKLPATWQ